MEGAQSCRNPVQQLVSNCEDFHRDCQECKKQKGEHRSRTFAQKGNTCVFFCLRCGGRPLCRNCSQVDHAGHDVIQVFYSTYKKAIQANGVVDKYLDTSKIQKLKNNGKHVILLLSRQTNNSKNNDNGSNKMCKTCMFKFVMLDDEGEFEFCSIQCMLMKRLQRNEDDVNGDSDDDKISDDVKIPIRSSGSRRKSLTPKRSPFM